MDLVGRAVAWPPLPINKRRARSDAPYRENSHTRGSDVLLALEPTFSIKLSGAGGTRLEGGFESYETFSVAADV